MFRQSSLVITLLVVACDSPQVVSFNTPELCVPDVVGLTTFTEAQSRCGKACALCVETELNDQALTYSVSHNDNCVCAVPRRLSHEDAGTPIVSDAGASADAGGVSIRDDASVPTGNADVGSDSEPTAGPDDCRSRLHLTQSRARALCSEWNDCNVCVERVDFDGDARSYMAHQCGCPDAYRIDPQ